MGFQRKREYFQMNGKMGQLGEKAGLLALVLTVLSLGTSPYPVALILCYFIHECGHLAVSHMMGAEMKRLKLGICHLSLTYDCSSLSYGKELAVQTGGIVFNLLSGLVVHFLPVLSGEVYDFFVVASISLALMNLLPISILDGGGMLKSILSMIFQPYTAERVCLYVSFACALVMWFFAVYLQIVFSSNLSFFFISVFLLVELCFSLCGNTVE